MQLFADELARSGIEVPPAVRDDPSQYEAFVRTKYEEAQWAAASTGSDSTGQPKRGFLGRARKGSGASSATESRQEGGGVGSALGRLNGSRSVPAEVVADNPLLAILEQESKI